MPYSYSLLSAFGSLISLAFFLTFVFLAVNAFQGSSVDLPVISEYAHKYV